MEQVVFALDASDALASSRKACVFKGIEAAMGTRAAVDRRDCASLGARRTSVPGLRRVRLRETLIAFDRAAHLGLADFEKRTIFTQDIVVDRPDVDIERLIWSSINTSRAIALGTPAWASLQALPISGISRHAMPPIDMGAAAEVHGASVRIIAHGHQPLAASATALLRRAGFAIADGGAAWCDEAAIHLHIGPHDLDAEEPRILDSWASGRLVIQMPGEADGPERRDALLVDHERNGIFCRSVGEIVATCEDVRADGTFWRQLVKGGHKTIVRHLGGWSDIAAAILA